jgi:hypothetical protein
LKDLEQPVNPAAPFDKIGCGTLKMDAQETALTDLLSLARRRGTLTMEDLQMALPANSMTEQEIAHVIARLDEAGFEVEIGSPLLLRDNETAAKRAAPMVKREETETLEPTPEGRQLQTSPPASADAPVLKNHTVRHSDSTASAPMLPWILAFAIVVLATFAAFAF